MSRSLGLREDRQAAQALLAWIVGSLPETPWGGYREQARSYSGRCRFCRRELAREGAGPGTVVLQVMTVPGGFKPAPGSPASTVAD